MNLERHEQSWSHPPQRLQSTDSVSLSSLSEEQNPRRRISRSTSLPNFSKDSPFQLSKITVNRSQVPTSFTLSNGNVGSDDFDHILLQELQDANFLRQLNFNFFHTFEKFHNCCSPDDDPLAGILNLDVVELGTACCFQKKLLVDLSKERRDNDKAIFTPYGRRLQEMAINYSSESFAVMTADYWNVQWRDSNDNDLTDYLQASFQEIDDDQVEWCFGECSICLAPCRLVRKPPCCCKAICYVCWRQFIRFTANNLNITGAYNLHCYYCAKLIPYSQALSCTDIGDIDFIRPKLQGANSATRCPICLDPAPAILGREIETATPKKQAAILRKLRQRKGGHPHVCSRCGNQFCRFCGAANHPKLSCQQLSSTEAGLSTWVEQKNATKRQFKNGRRCPKCHICVTHNGGCPHMTCPCGTEFCYLCGKSYFKPFLGLQAFHTSSKVLPFITCPKLWRSQPKRILVHSLVTLSILTGVLPVVATLTPIVLPVVLTYIAVDRYKRRRHS